MNQEHLIEISDWSFYLSCHFQLSTGASYFLYPLIIRVKSTTTLNKQLLDMRLVADDFYGRSFQTNIVNDGWIVWFEKGGHKSSIIYMVLLGFIIRWLIDLAPNFKNQTILEFYIALCWDQPIKPRQSPPSLILGF